ncbi:glutamate--cysteine ligase [Psychrobacter pacificensis]|uniref:glutamate--cysteine ligase n=1 Tax=Psychrobacter pacificensis TaxID=112002 RepID=UPI001CBDC8E5|nr:glutamate--cysteine ligase [Psychrobacter pacificensis]MBZ1393451.1 glutamate--cysteine ligase [Psychrobacter pacificensis]MDE0844329.1 glutamate--cysteine ligase [Psychrobacter pacificensis]
MSNFASSFANFDIPNWFDSQHLTGMLRGIEKEGLRVRPDGFLAQTPHPAKLGSKLTHPFITTDYSESLLELITEPKASPKETLNMLRQLHVLVYQGMPDGELMWPLSMPCMLSSKDEDIPLADYGSSNTGKLKTLYRSGLGIRYGRRMQTIAGLHYNLSFGDTLFETWQAQTPTAQEQTLTEFKNEKYLGLIRNFKRLTSIVLYLLGASPSVCPCFVAGREHDLERLNDSTYYKPTATSLRMGKLGYTNSVQEQLDIRYNYLPEYVAGLRRAIQTPHESFAKLGLEDEDGNPVQINNHILQIENEYYSPIRPKQIAMSGETPTEALERRGIAYVEFRAIDLDPYSDVGIRLSSACFLEVMALYCLFSDSPDLLPEEEEALAINLERVVNEGRREGLHIINNGQEQSLEGWMLMHLERMQPLAALLDAHYGGNDYRAAVALMQGKAGHSESTISAQVNSDSKRLGSLWQLGFTLAQQHRESLLQQTLSPNTQAKYEVLAEKSILQQAEIEKSETADFMDFLQQYR